MPDTTASPVALHVYDLTHGFAKELSPTFLGRQVDGVWHTGVVVDGVEYFYGYGIHSAAAGQTPLGDPTNIITLGETTLPEDVRNQYLVEVSSGQFSPGAFSLLNNNSNTFSNAFAMFLTGQGVPDYIQSLPEDLSSTPAGQAVLSLLSAWEAALATGEDAPPNLQPFMAGFMSRGRPADSPQEDAAGDADNTQGRPADSQPDRPSRPHQFGFGPRFAGMPCWGRAGGPRRFFCGPGAMARWREMCSQGMGHAQCGPQQCGPQQCGPDECAQGGPDGGPSAGATTDTAPPSADKPSGSGQQPEGSEQAAAPKQETPPEQMSPDAGVQGADGGNRGVPICAAWQRMCGGGFQGSRGSHGPCRPRARQAWRVARDVEYFDDIMAEHHVMSDILAAEAGGEGVTAAGAAMDEAKAAEYTEASRGAEDEGGKVVHTTQQLAALDVGAIMSEDMVEAGAESEVVEGGGMPQGGDGQKQQGGPSSGDDDYEMVA